jgi:HK97 gp10 family phage protein
MQLTVKVTGSRETAARLARLSDAMAGQVLERAATSGALLVANAAKEKCPYRTGNLRRSIHVGGHVGESGGLVDTTGQDLGGNQNSRTHAEVVVGTDVEYAAPIEYGANGRAARPFMRPALDSQREAVVQEIGAALRDLLAAM